MDLPGLKIPQYGIISFLDNTPLKDSHILLSSTNPSGDVKLGGCHEAHMLGSVIIVLFRVSQSPLYHLMSS